MNKNQSINIEPLQNGFLVEYSYRKLDNPEATERYDRYEYFNEKSMFKTWDEVIGFLKTKELEVPPVK